MPPIDLETDTRAILAPDELVEVGIEQRLEMAPDDLLDIPGISQRRQLIGQDQPHGRAASTGQARGRNPFPWGAMPRREMPPGRDVRRASDGFGDDLARHQQPELDPDAGKADALASGLAARCDVVISGQLPPLHPAPVVDDRQGPVGRVGAQADERRTRVERVGNDFGQDCFFERTGIGIAKVFKQMLEIDPGFTHGRILSLPALSRAGPRPRPRVIVAAECRTAGEP